MKLRIFAFLFSILIIGGCGSAKDSSQRRNFMMPEKADLPRNSAKYSGSKKKKTYTVTKQKKRKSSSNY
jgi:hypothetical protein